MFFVSAAREADWVYAVCTGSDVVVCECALLWPSSVFLKVLGDLIFAPHNQKLSSRLLFCDHAARCTLFFLFFRSWVRFLGRTSVQSPLTPGCPFAPAARGLASLLVNCSSLTPTPPWALRSVHGMWIFACHPQLLPVLLMRISQETDTSISTYKSNLTLPFPGWVTRSHLSKNLSKLSTWTTRARR